MPVSRESIEVIGGFVVRALLSLIAVIFSCVMLYRDSQNPVYIGLMSTIIGTWFPSNTLSVSDIVNKLRKIPDAPAI